VSKRKLELLTGVTVRGWCAALSWTEQGDGLLCTNTAGGVTLFQRRESGQVCVNPTQVCVNPTQVCVNPTQVCVNPTQAELARRKVLIWNCFELFLPFKSHF
jgi:hypothetical protein